MVKNNVYYGIIRFGYQNIVVAIVLLFLWWLITLSDIPSFLLPTPKSVLLALWHERYTLAHHGLITVLEMIAGLLIGILLGSLLAIGMIFFPVLEHWLVPVVLISQIIPALSLAPLLVLWFGYGMSAKIAMTSLIIFFPVTSSFFDGLRRVNSDYLDLAITLGASSYTQFRHVRLMAALPAFSSGIRMAVASAPTGAIIGEWVGSAKGLGYIMLNANARMQTDLCFAAIFILILITLFLWNLFNRLIKHFIFWEKT
ncbi:ABC transporter permease [Sodalis sp. CWE]|nr:ABC transporter permease [Sodalis sp. CWE]